MCLQKVLTKFCMHSLCWLILVATFCYQSFFKISKAQSTQIFSLLFNKKISFFFLKPIPKCQILHSSELKKFADDNFKFVENGDEFPQKGKKHCRKRRNRSLYEQSILFPQSFQKTCTADT